MSCKVPTDCGLIDLDAPTMPAFEWRYYSYHVFVVLCERCRAMNNHGPREGHRYTHCAGDDCPYHRTGYNMVRVGAVLTIPQLAKRVGAAPRTIRRLVRNGDLSAVTYRGRKFILAYDHDFPPPSHAVR